MARVRADAISVVLLALSGWLAAAAAFAAQDPFVNEPPPPGAVCPAIAEDYALCRRDLMSDNCRDFVAAAHALSRLYLFNVQRQPERAHEFETTIWWQCGSASLVELKALLLRIDSPEARAVLAEAPYRSLPTPQATGPAPPASATSRQQPGPPDCTALVAPAEYEACQQRALEQAESRLQRQVEHCGALLTPFLHDQLEASQKAWQRDRVVECAPGEGHTRCLTTATQERTEAIARTYPQCGAGDTAAVPAVSQGPPKGGPRSGMLPARWTPPQGTPQEVPFNFESLGRDTGQGTMHTTLGPDGERFDGTYLRIEQSTQGKLVTAMSIDWSGPEWELWKHDPDGSWTPEGVSVGEFAHFYTGKVVATLQGSRGHAMRCQFTLKDPEAGLLEGGTGRCQVTDGGRVSLEF